jgi:S-adenosylmethionine synthetase
MYCSRIQSLEYEYESVLESSDFKLELPPVGSIIKLQGSDD